MRTYLLRRLTQAVLVLWAAYTLAFVLLSALPGDAIYARIQNPDNQISPEMAAVMIDYYGIGRPLIEQYAQSLLGVFRGDLGFSLNSGYPVAQLIGDALPGTIQLSALGLVFGVLFAVVTALGMNYAPWARVRSLLGAIPTLFGSVPTFVVGIFVLQFLSFRFHLIPAVDDGSLHALIAPAATLGLVISASMAQVFATSIARTRNQPFAHVQHAKGAGELYIFRKDVLRNSSLPVLTLLGLVFGELLSGSVITETVFARGGIGQLTVGAISGQDLPVVQGVVLLATAVFVVVNLAVDVAYPVIDPRILATTRVVSRRASRKAAAKVLQTDSLGDRSDADALPRPNLPVEVAMP